MGFVLGTLVGSGDGANVGISSFTQYPRLSGQPNTPAQKSGERGSPFIPWQHLGGTVVPLHTSEGGGGSKLCLESQSPMLAQKSMSNVVS